MNHKKLAGIQSMFTFGTFPRYKVIFSARVYFESQPTAE